MFRRILVAAAFLFALLSTSQTASACAVCKYGGFICNANGCEPVEYCAGTSYPKRGYTDCYFIGSTCINSGEQCVWASLIEPVQPEQPRCDKAS